MDENTPQNNVVLRELSDIKSSLAVSTNEILNLKSTLNELKQSNREISSGYISRREFQDALQALRNEIPSSKGIDDLKAFMWKLTGGLVVISILIPIIISKFL